jgi:hypothetical protein
MSKKGIFPTRYGIHEEVPGEGKFSKIDIRYAPPFISHCNIPNRPESWYITRSMMNSMKYNAGFRVEYWSSNGWQIDTPVRFSSAELAYGCYLKEIADQTLKFSTDGEIHNSNSSS